MAGEGVTIEPLACGTLTANRSFFEQGGPDEPIALPVPAWLIRHPQGTVLFDTGMPADLAHDTQYRRAVSRFFDVGCTEEDMVDARLATRELDPGDVDVVIVSHLHFDHTGGLARIPDARLVIQADEWAAGTDDELAARNTFQRSQFDLGHERVLADGDHDVFGDGRVVCLPTPGHTPGHQSLRVRTDSTEVVLCGDCAYFEETLEGGALPPRSHDRDAHAASVARLRSLRAGGAHVIPGHDPTTFAALPARLT